MSDLNEIELKQLKILINNKDIFYYEDDFNNIIRPLVGKLLDLYNKTEKELNNLKEIEQLHKEENGKLNVEINELEHTLYAKQSMIDELTHNEEKLKIELGKEKEKNKELITENFSLNEMKRYNQKHYISKDKIKLKKEQTKKVYEDEMKPYQTEYGLDVTYLSKKEKDELINKRNCLLTQIKTYEMLLEEKQNV